MIELVLGGARSGKSAYAQRRALESGLPVVYLATAQAGDAEMAARIIRHRAERPSDWRTLEEPLALAEALVREAEDDRCLIVDCLTLWLSNVLLAGKDEEIGHLLEILPTLPGRILLVSNEVGYGIVPENALARRFRDEQGRLNQAIAALAERVTLVVAGISLVIKGA